MSDKHEVVRERDQAYDKWNRARAARDLVRFAWAGAEDSLVAEREHSERLTKERDEARAEVERLRGGKAEVSSAKLSAAFTEGTLAAGDAMRDHLRTVAERQREACAEAVKRFWGVGDYSAEVQACRAAPLVTERKP